MGVPAANGSGRCCFESPRRPIGSGLTGRSPIPHTVPVGRVRLCARNQQVGGTTSVSFRPENTHNTQAAVGLTHSYQFEETLLLRQIQNVRTHRVRPIMNSQLNSVNRVQLSGFNFSGGVRRVYIRRQGGGDVLLTDRWSGERERGHYGCWCDWQ